MTPAELLNQIEALIPQCETECQWMEIARMEIELIDCMTAEDRLKFSR